MNDTIGEVLIIDVSEGVGIIDYEAVAQLGIDGVIMRATEKKIFDERFKANWDGFGAVGIPRGLYFFHSPSDSGANNKLQAEAAAEAIEYCGVKPELNVYGDWETDYLGLTIQQYRDAVWKYILRFEDLTSIRLDAYTSKNKWDKEVANSTNGTTDIPHGRELWVANWRSAPPPLIPYDWEHRSGPNCWLLWQYANKRIIPGCPGTVDFNTFNGFRAEFYAHFKLEPIPEPPPPEPEPEPEPTTGLQMEAIEPKGLNVRSGPGTNFSIIGSLPLGQICTVYEIGGSSAWVRISPDGESEQWANVQYGDDVNMVIVKGA